MNKYLPVLIVSLMLSACGSTNVLVASRATPDELRVIDAPPLTLPPNFDLRPPRAGEKGKLTVREHTQKAEQIVLKSTNSESTPAQKADWLVQKAGGDSRDPDIRLKLDVEAEVDSVEEAKKGWLGSLFGADKPAAQEVSTN